MTEEQLIDRPVYLSRLEAWKNKTDIVKIVTGIRRCGKSKLLTLFQNKILAEKQAARPQIISVNLENTLETRKIGLALNDKNRLTDYSTLLDFILSKLHKDKMNYVFIDEVQLLENWQQLANTLRLLDNVDIYLTGSNAYMFSSDLANSFGGRYIEIKIQPFSFKEYCVAYAIKRPNDNPDSQEVYNRYIKGSGFPQTTAFMDNQQLIDDYLEYTVYLNTVQKDIIQRFNIVDTNKLNIVAQYLFDNIGNETSLRNIERGINASGRKVSVPSIDTYINGLLDSYLLYKCDRYDIKGKHILDSNAKYYVADVGLRNSLLGHEDKDLGHILENVVYLELLRRGYKVYVGKTNTQANGQRKSLEVDFVAQKPEGEIEYYQVALYALQEETLQRELKPLQEINDNYPKYLLSMDYGEGNSGGIKRLNVLEWLLSYE